MEPKGSLPFHKSPPLVPILSHKWVPCHHFMSRSQVADEDGFQIRRVAANIFNKQ
jgi:hypothetical protein